MNTIQHFDNLELDTHIRVIEHQEQILFVAKDVCDALGHSNSRVAVSRLHEDERVTLTPSNVTDRYISIPNRGLQFVTESGLYALIFASQMEAAQTFRRWVTSEVLPAIRKHGRYDPQELAAQMPPTVRRAYLLAQMEELEAELIRLRAQADIAAAIPGQYTVFQWLLMQGEEPNNKDGSLGRLSQQCRRRADQLAIKCGEVKIIDHCGQITRLSRTARTFPEHILADICGQATA